METDNIRKHLDQIFISKQELYQAGVIRSERFTGELGEYIAELQLGGKRASTTSNRGWDLIAKLGNLKEDQKVQVKCHAKGSGNRARWTEFKGINHFDWLFIIVLTHDFRIKEMFLIPKKDLEKNARKNAQNVWLASWDDFQKFQIRPADYNPLVTRLFGGSDHTQIHVNSTDSEQIDSYYPEERWEILSSLTAKTIYFAPTSWKCWNANPKGVFGTNRSLVFEYRTPKWHSAKDKITLRGLIPDPTPNKNLASTAETFGWNLPKKGKPKNTQGYAIWQNSGIGANMRHQAPPYPSKGFSLEDDFLDWLDQWEKNVGNASPGSIWNFILKI